MPSCFIDEGTISQVKYGTQTAETEPANCNKNCSAECPLFNKILLLTGFCRADGNSHPK